MSHSLPPPPYTDFTRSIDDVGFGWRELFAYYETTHGLKFIQGIFTSMGLGEETVALIKFSTPDNTTIYEVGIGAAMRPYDQLNRSLTLQFAWRLYRRTIARFMGA